MIQENNNDFLEMRKAFNKEYALNQSHRYMMPDPWDEDFLSPQKRGFIKGWCAAKSSGIRWISVTDSLPKNYGQYLVRIKTHKSESSVYHDVCFFSKRHGDTHAKFDHRISDCITHWSTYPEDPEYPNSSETTIMVGKG